MQAVNVTPVNKAIIPRRGNIAFLHGTDDRAGNVIPVWRLFYILFACRVRGAQPFGPQRFTKTWTPARVNSLLTLFSPWHRMNIKGKNGGQ
jgi:hypothetical protein